MFGNVVNLTRWRIQFARGKNIYKYLNVKHLKDGLSVTVHVIPVTKHVKLDRSTHPAAIVRLVFNLGMVHVKLCNVSLVGRNVLNHVVAEKLFVKFSRTVIMSLKNEDVTNNRVQSKPKVNQSVPHVTMVTGFANRHRARMGNLAK